MIQRFPQPFNDYNDAESYNPLKTHETPPQNRSAAGFAICAETSEKLDFKRFSGIEKVHRNSINYGGLLAERKGFEPLRRY